MSKQRKSYPLLFGANKTKTIRLDIICQYSVAFCRMFPWALSGRKDKHIHTIIQAFKINLSILYI